MAQQNPEFALTRGHARLFPNEVSHEVQQIQPVSAVYVRVDDLKVAPDLGLWIVKSALALTATEALEKVQNETDDELARLIIIPRVKIIDLTAGVFNIGGKLKSKLPVNSEVTYDTKRLYKINKILRTAEQREHVEAHIKRTYDKDIGHTVLNIASHAPAWEHTFDSVSYDDPDSDAP